MKLIWTSILAFISTNVDDIFLLILFFSDRSYKKVQVITGQYLGVITLVAISFLASLGASLLDQRYVGLLGLFPIYLGVKKLLELFRDNSLDDDLPEMKFKRFAVLSVAAVTCANGGDNIGIYIPLFATQTLSEKVIMISIFMVMIFIWCFAAMKLATHPLLAKAIEKYGHIITPFVLIILGMLILWESNSASLLF